MGFPRNQPDIFWWEKPKGSMTNSCGEVRSLLSTKTFEALHSSDKTPCRPLIKIRHRTLALYLKIQIQILTLPAPSVSFSIIDNMRVQNWKKLMNKCFIDTKLYHYKLLPINISVCSIPNSMSLELINELKGMSVTMNNVAQKHKWLYVVYSNASS